jgi:hypothetical protein
MIFSIPTRADPRTDTFGPRFRERNRQRWPRHGQQLRKGLWRKSDQVVTANDSGHTDHRQSRARSRPHTSRLATRRHHIAWSASIWTVSSSPLDHFAVRCPLPARAPSRATGRRRCGPERKPVPRRRTLGTPPRTVVCTCIRWRSATCAVPHRPKCPVGARPDNSSFAPLRNIAEVGLFPMIARRPLNR